MKRFSKISRFLNRTGKRMGDRKRIARQESFNVFFKTFQKILTANNQMLAVISEMGDKLSGDYIFDSQYIRSACREAEELTQELITGINILAPGKYTGLNDAFQHIQSEIQEEQAGRPVIPKTDHIMLYHLINRDFEDVVGAKNANLGEIKNVLELNVPDGFAITTRAFDSFMSVNNLWDKVKTITDAWYNKELSVEKASQQIQTLIADTKIPDPLKKAVDKASGLLYRGIKGQKPFLAVRSSAWGEDSGHSFAGQYLSLLNEPADHLLDCYKKIVASAYSASAMEYRRNKGFSEKEVVMAVGCQLMINPRTSGVLYTFDPQMPERDLMLISSTWGLGAPIVDGRSASDHFQVNRRFPYAETLITIAEKTEKLVLQKNGGTKNCSVPNEGRTAASLTPKQLKLLAKTALMIERHFKTPQDIEFAFDKEGTLFILQARPLNIQINRSMIIHDLPDILSRHPILFGNKGTIAQRGIAIGKVFKIFKDEDIDVFPLGAILVAKYTSPRFAKVIRKTAGIITDVGSATGHMATIAREFRVPTIVNTGNATALLESKQEITMDAEENNIYKGIIKELRNYHLIEAPIEETFEYRLLRRVLKKTGSLNLLDPTADNFTPSGCKTFHDITRFVHEKAVEELINLQYYHHHDPKTATGKLKLPVPLDLVLIDIGAGLVVNENEKSAPIVPEQIDSIPMRAFIDGLLMPGAWDTDPMSVGLGSFMSSMTRTFSTNMATPKDIGQNLAVISKPYANISLRLGYHFTMIDAYIDDNPNNNYAYFRFLGGVTDITKRSRRALLLSEILEKNDFFIEVRGDLVVARIKKLTTERMVRKLYLLGVLVGFSRQLDVQMLSDQHVHRYMENFNQLITSNSNIYEHEGSHYEQ